MSPRVRIPGEMWLALVVCCSAIALSGDARPASAQPLRAAALPRGRPSSMTPTALDGHALVKRARVEDGRMRSSLDSGQSVELTIMPELQEHVRRVLARYAVPYGAFAAIEPSTGRVLAYVSHSSADPSAGDLVADASPPAASVFKLITASALVDAGVSTEAKTCYGGGASSLAVIDLVDDPRRDGACANLAQATGGSLNAVFAKLADRHLDPAKLSRTARAFGFGQVLPGQLRLDTSAIDLPDDRLEFARSAAGFWHSHLSPMHGALLAATIANGGVMHGARLIERVEGGAAAAASPGQRVVSAATARAVGTMMLRTVRDGTSREAFHDARGRPYLKDMEIAGKTGSLSRENPYRAYSWWVGFAPADAPVIALAALVVNSPRWRIKASFLARDALEHVLAGAIAARCARLAGQARPLALAGRCAKTNSRQGANSR